MRKQFYHAYNPDPKGMWGNGLCCNLVFMPYIIYETTELICDYNFESKKILASRYALTTVNTNFLNNK